MKNLFQNVFIGAHSYFYSWLHIRKTLCGLGIYTEFRQLGRGSEVSRAFHLKNYLLRSLATLRTCAPQRLPLDPELFVGKKPRKDRIGRHILL